MAARRMKDALFRGLQGSIVLTILAVFFLQGYAAIIHSEGNSPLPRLFGNFPTNQAVLETQAPKSEFAFAVVGDTKSTGTFEKIADELKRTPLDFAVLLGDCSYDGTEEAHRYFRAECVDEYAMPFPVFYVVGNHDVSPRDFTVDCFERDYGPSIFSFEYQNCLFIILRVLNQPFSNEESIEYLSRFKEVPLEKFRYCFVFMHIPPPLSPDILARRFKGHEKLVELFDELRVDYVYAGDFHGYAKIKLRNTTYIVSGGGGAHLKKEKGRQFHHALVVSVGQNFVGERFVYVPRVHDFEDVLEKYAIIEVWPWMLENLLLLVLIDVALIALLVFLVLKPLFTRPNSLSRIE